MDIEYWKQRAEVAESTLAKLMESNPIDPYLVADLIVKDTVQFALFRADYYEAQMNIWKGRLDAMASQNQLDMNVVNSIARDLINTLRRFENGN